MLRDLLVVDGLTLREGKHSRQALAQLWPLRRLPEQPALDFANLAHTGQLVFSEFMNELLRNAYSYGVSDNLVRSGGCALNSAYVGSLARDLPFKNSFVFCAPADNGNAVGAALLAYREDNKAWTRRNVVQSPYLGSRIEPRALDRLLRYGELQPLEIGANDDFFARVAEELSRGKIVAWVQGRAEFGPRALGNRSILADPRNSRATGKQNRWSTP